MKHLYIYSNNVNSGGAKALSVGLGALRIKHYKSQFRPSSNKIVINWGSGSPLPGWTEGCNILNIPQRVAIAVDKGYFFSLNTSNSSPCRMPDWTKDPEEVKKDIEQYKSKWLARTVVNGHSGLGIIVIETPIDIPKAPLYTKYVPKKEEYRVHWFGNRIIHVQRKAARSDFEGQPNWTIRSHNNGFKFVHGPALGTVPDDVMAQSEKGFNLSGLDFGAVDVIWNAKKEEAYVLEINTAPGLEGTTVEKYIDAFRSLLS